jgi:hypothetical protein
VEWGISLAVSFKNASGSSRYAVSNGRIGG